MGIKLRPSVKRFAEMMENQLRRNDHKGGWENDAPSALLVRLIEETGELGHAMILRMDGNTVAKEAADVANFAMMIAENCGWKGDA